MSAITDTQATRFVQDALNPSGYSQILEERNASNSRTEKKTTVGTTTTTTRYIIDHGCLGWMGKSQS